MGSLYVQLLDALVVNISKAPFITNETVTFAVQLSASPQRDVSLSLEAVYDGTSEQNVSFTILPESPLVFAADTSELSIEVVITAANFVFDVSEVRKRQTGEGLLLSFGQPTNAFLSPDVPVQLSFPGAIFAEPDGNGSNDEGGNKSSDNGVGAEVIAPVVVVCVLLVLVVVAIVVLVRRKNNRQKQKTVEDLESGMDSMYAAPSGDKAGKGQTRNERRRGSGDESRTWEIEFSELEFQEEIGRGAFGVVWRAIWRDSEVAVKKLNGMDEHELDDFRAEALVMKGLRPHANVIQLYGVCSGEDSSKCIVTEFMQMGNLLSYLRKHADDIEPSQMIQWAIDIAAGLRHLHKDGISHRDLAARNLLLTAQLNVKVSDFGLSRKREGESAAQKTTTEVGPLKWMSPEAISELEYSEKSDVWSYGVCLWEIVTKGEEPFDGLNVVKAAIEICEKGTRLTVPQDAPKVLAKVMQQCWSSSPQAKPTFADIVSALKKAA